MKFLKVLAITIACSLPITATVFAGQKYVNEKNGYEITLVDGDIVAMSDNFTMTMNSKTQTAYLVGRVNNIFGNISTGEFTALYAKLANLEKAQGWEPVVLPNNTANVLNVKVTSNTSTLNKLLAIHFKIAELDASAKDDFLPFASNDFYIVSKNNGLYLLGTFSTHALPSEDTANNFSEFLKSFKPIRQNNINKKFLYTDAIAGYDFTLPKDWCYVQGKMGELGLFTVALPLDKLSNVLEAVINIGIPVSQGMEDQEIAKILMKATDEGIVAFSSKKTLKKNSMFYDILNNMRNSDAEHIDFSLQQLKNNLGNELNKADFTIDYIAAAANSDANKNLIINLKSRLVYNKDFPIELNSKTLINDSFISSMNYFKHTGEKNSQRANLALIRRIDNLKVAQK